MKLIQYLTLLLVLHISSIDSQSAFKIGVLDQDLLNYIRNVNYKNFTLQLISLPNPILATNYNSVNFTLSDYDVIIGRLNFVVATMCQQMNLPYFFLGDYISTFPGALLEVGSDLRTAAQMLLIYLNKYNINYPLRFISDSASDATIFRSALGEITTYQCNFNPLDTPTTIQACYNIVFKGTAKSNYIFITDPTNSDQLDTYIQQSLFMSLPANSMVFLPMVDILQIFSRYYFSGGYLFELAPEITTTTQNGTLLQRKAMTAYNHVYASLSPYTKINATHWISNNITTAYNKSVILNILKTSRGQYQSNGQTVLKSYYLYTTANNNILLVSALTFANTWTENSGYPNPATVGAKGFLTIVYVLDSVFITEVSTPAGTVIQGFAVELLSYLLLPIQVTYISNKYAQQPIIGNNVNNTFNGLLGQMANNPFFSMTAFPVPVVPSYRTQLTYSNGIFDIQYSMLIRQANKTVQYYGLAQPFSPLVWLAILATIMFLSIILFSINLISPNVAASVDKLTPSNCIFLVFGSFLIAKMLVKPNMFSTQIFYLLIWLGTLLLIASYVSNLFVAAAFSNSTKIQFTTLAGLYAQKNYKWAFVNNSYLHNKIMIDIANNQESIYATMFNYSRDNWGINHLVQPENVEQFALNNADTGVLNDHIHNLQISLQDCLLTTQIDTSFSESMAYVISPTFPFVRDLSNQILLLRQSGVIDLLLTKYFGTGVCPTATVRSAGISGFDYQDMCGVFILVLVGIVLSFIVAGIEYLVKKLNLQCQRFVKGNSLQFGQVYKGKVKSLDKNGVTVKLEKVNCFTKENDARIYYIPKENLLGKGKKKENQSKSEIEIPSPTEQGIMIGTTLYLKYLGNNPKNSKRKFVQVPKK